ncbi:mRNA cleavage and polyadenylation specificity factor complex subunit [Xylariaceae sp. FL0016]|nr:mRNA cleavage and polyadenylation specificity factor complex subunit [Xylariaceae sp. FL0016]
MASGQQQLSVPDQIRQLEDARKLVLSDVTYYLQVIQATLPIIGPSSRVEFRRWGAEFLAEAFATPAVSLGQKETFLPLVLETLKSLVEDPNQDILVLRSAIQAAASTYPLAIRWIVNNSYDTTTWEHMVAIKTRILQIWDTAPLTVRICCVKFAQRVVLAQTRSINPEPRRNDPLDISLIMIPLNHSVLDSSQFEAEASGLLDRMLTALQDNKSDVLIIDATLNTLSILIRARPATSPRILNVLLNFNPLRMAKLPMSPKTKVIVKSIEKTTRMLLVHLSRRDSHNPLTPRIQQYLERLMRFRAEVFEDRKRAPPQHDASVEAKRQRIANMSSQPQIEVIPLKAGPCSLAEVFTLTNNQGLRGFNVSDMIPAPLAAKISVRTIAQLDSQILQRAIDGIRDRLTTLHATQQQPINPETAPLDVEDEDDDYEPDYYNAAEDAEQLQNKLDSSPMDERRELQKPTLGGLALPSFKLPPPPVLDADQAAKAGQGSIARVFSTMKTLEDPATKRQKAGLNRLAASSYDRDSWATVMTRLATRTNSGLDDISVKAEDSLLQLPRLSPGNAIREAIYGYILEDFRRRIETAVSWLSEEWYNDKVQQRAAAASALSRDVPVHYNKWALRLLDGFLPYLNSQDKVLTRFLSELPELNTEIFSRVKDICRDPSLVNLAISTLYYLVVTRPPVRDMALDAVQDIWTEYEDSRPAAAKTLQRWRPEFLEAGHQRAGVDGTPMGANATAVTT